MGWFWAKEKEEDIDELRMAIEANKTVAAETIRVAKRSKTKSQELLRLGEQALEILEGEEKKK